MKKGIFIRRSTVFPMAVLGLLGILGATSCQFMPKNTVPVSNFDVNRYMGKWYEIARFDFIFEKNMNQTTAHYALQEDGSVEVVNRGYDYVKKNWKEAHGKAKFRGDTTVGALKVSFFGPFYSGYNVIALDSDYQYVLIAGKNLDYLWILSRTTTIPDEVKKSYLELASSLGYDVGKLIWVDQTPDNSGA